PHQAEKVAARGEGLLDAVEPVPGEGQLQVAPPRGRLFQHVSDVVVAPGAERARGAVRAVTERVRYREDLLPLPLADAPGGVVVEHAGDRGDAQSGLLRDVFQSSG